MVVQRLRGLLRVDLVPVAYLAWIGMLLAIDIASGRSRLADFGITGVVGVVVTCGAVAVRRARPGLAAVSVIALLTVADLPSGDLLRWAWAPAWLHLTARAARVGSRAAVLATAAACAAIGSVGLVLAPEETSWEGVLLAPLPLAAGLAARGYDRWQRGSTLVEQHRAWEDERAAVERERARIARELHDVVAHHVSGMVVSAGAALRVLDRDRATALATLAAVADSADRAGDAMRSMLGAFTDGDGEQEVDAGEQPGLGDLDELVGRFDRLGCRVRLEVDDQVGDVPADVGLSVFRIVQEGLTNALKHAGPVPVTVRVTREGTGLGVHVEDPGPAGGAPPAPLGSSHQGLIGMGERVAVFGGTLRAGPVDGGGWAVHATVPLA